MQATSGKVTLKQRIAMSNGVGVLVYLNGRPCLIGCTSPFARTLKLPAGTDLRLMWKGVKRRSARRVTGWRFDTGADSFRVGSVAFNSALRLEREIAQQFAVYVEVDEGLKHKGEK